MITFDYFVANFSESVLSERMLKMGQYLVHVGGGLAQLVTSLVASTKLINAGPG